MMNNSLKSVHNKNTMFFLKFDGINYCYLNLNKNIIFKHKYQTF